MRRSARYDDVSRVEELIRDSELVIGIPSRNVAHTIAYVIHNVVLGIRRYLRGLASSIIVCDGFSTDPTVDVVRAYRSGVGDVPISVIPNTVSRGKGGAIKLIIDLVSKYSRAKSLVLLDSDLRSITPEWVAILHRGTMGCGLVTPKYLRHKYDATITNFIARPLIVLTYGVDIKQPIGGDFGLSRELIDRLSRSRLWSVNEWALYFGIDSFITITALAEGFEVCEAELGVKIHEGKDPGTELKSMFSEVFSSIATMLREYLSTWINRRVDYITEPRTIREPRVPKMAPWEVRVSVSSARKLFIEGLKKYWGLYRDILPEEVLKRLASSEGINSDLWGDVLANTLIYVIRGRGGLADVSQALLHLWQGRLYSYYREVSELDSEEAYRLVTEEVRSILRLRKHVIENITSPNTR